MADEPWWHEDDGPARPGDPLGSAAQEASKLFTAMRDRMLADPATLRAGLRIMDAFGSLRGSGTPVAPGGARECAYCPICQAMTRAKSLNPESVERLTGAAMEFAEVVRQVVLQTPDAEPDTVRHVPLDEDYGGWPEPADSDPIDFEFDGPVEKRETTDDDE